MSLQEPAAPVLTGRPRLRSRLRLRTSWLTPYLYVLPALLLVGAVTGYGIVYAIDFSFYDGSLTRKTDFVGLDNYREIASNPTIRGNVVTTFVYMLFAVPLSVGLGLAFALLVNQRVRGTQFVRTILILPWTTSLVITALLWSFLLNPEIGPLSEIVSTLGLGDVNLLGPGWAMPALVVASSWNAYAFSMVLLLAALQQIPPNVRRAARTDGASAWFTFRKITLPYIRPTLLVTLVLASMHYVNVIELPLILTGGGPDRATEILPLRLYNEAFSYYRTGLASAMAVVVLVINLLITTVYLRALRDRRKLLLAS